MPLLRRIFAVVVVWWNVCVIVILVIVVVIVVVIIVGILIADQGGRYADTRASAESHTCAALW